MRGKAIISAGSGSVWHCPAAESERSSAPMGSREIMAAAVALLLATPATASAAASPTEAPDISLRDPARRALLDALRPVVERDLGQKLVFIVHVLRVQDAWAFADLAPRTPAGAPIDFARTRHAERLREGMLD